MKAYYASEQQIQQSIINYLKYKRYKVIRLNTGAIKTQHGSLVRLAEKGTPDILAFMQDKGYVDLIFIEVKKPKNKPTPAQEAMLIELQQYGARCFVAHSVEEVEKWL